MELIVVVKIAALIALVAFVVLAVFFVISINSFIKLTKSATKNLETLTNDVSDSLGQITSDIKDLKIKLVESLIIMDETSKQIEQSTQHIEKQANEIIEIFEPFKSLAKSSYNIVATPINRLNQFISASTKGVTAFLDGIVSRL